MATNQGNRNTGAQSREAVISDLALVNYESESDAIQAASLLYRAAQSPNLLAANQLANALQRSEGVQRFQSAERRAVQALLALPADAVSRRAVAILERAHEVVLHEENRQRRDEVSRSLALASGPLGTPDGKKYLRELPLPSDAESRYALVLDFVAQVDAAVAAERVAGELEAARETYLAAEDDDVRAAARTEIVRLFECFDELALRSPRASRAAARDLPRRSRPRFYSDRLLRVLERVDALELAMPAPFLRAAARISREGAAVALRHGLRRSGLNEDQLRAVLAGLGRWGLQGEDAFRDARVLVERRSQLMAPLDQLAYIALEGSTEAAEQLYGREDLLKDIVQTAREQLSHNRERAELLLRASTAWKGSTQEKRKVAAAEYAKAVADARTEEELEAVLQTALSFFENPDQVESVRELRANVKVALGRLGQVRSAALQELLRRASTELRIQPEDQNWYDVLLREAGVPDEGSAL